MYTQVSSTEGVTEHELAPLCPHDIASVEREILYATASQFCSQFIKQVLICVIVLSGKKGINEDY